MRSLRLTITAAQLLALAGDCLSRFEPIFVKKDRTREAAHSAICHAFRRSRLGIGAPRGISFGISRRRALVQCIDSNLVAVSSDIVIEFEGIDLEIDMVILSSTFAYLPLPMPDRRNSPDTAFGVWATIALFGLAIVSVALGFAPLGDPLVFASP
jgi:hypothetical protein